MPKYPESPQEWTVFTVENHTNELIIGGWQVMQEWERPLMKRMAHNVAGAGKRVLEVGFGMGICAEEIWKIGYADYTVIEAHPIIAENARKRIKAANIRGRVIEGFWQEIIKKLPERGYDGIIFDTYPLSESERSKNHYSFIPLATQLLSDEGALTYYSDETEDFRADHLKLLLANYGDVELERISGLNPPEDCEYWNTIYMIIPKATKPIR